MNISIEVWLEDTVFNGEMYGEGENELYDKYEEWMNSKDADRFIDTTTFFLKEWDSDVQVEGGTMMNPNGLIWYLHCKFSPIMIKDVQSRLEDNLNDVLRMTKNCPVPLEFRVYVEEE